MSKTFRVSLSLLFMLLINNVFAADKLEVNLAYVGCESKSAALGVKQGIDEANLQGEFLGQSYTLQLINPNKMTELAGVTAIFAAVNEKKLRELAALNPTLPIFNLTDRSDTLRKKCVSNLYHAIPSDKMAEDAVAQWLQKNAGSKASAAGWHGDFKKYAASQVNKRFKKSQGEIMDDAAYAGWIAAKIIADAVVRTNSVDAEKLNNFLKNDLVMDGAKGLKMNFRPTGQLRQMMLLVEDGKMVGEAPVRGVVDTTDLESLGILECGDCK